jgi:hypothetical protein
MARANHGQRNLDRKQIRDSLPTEDDSKPPRRLARLHGIRVMAGEPVERLGQGNVRPGVGERPINASAYRCDTLLAFFLLKPHPISNVTPCASGSVEP